MGLRTVQREGIGGCAYCSSAMDAEQSEICSRWLSSSVMTDIWVEVVVNTEALLECLGRINNIGET